MSNNGWMPIESAPSDELVLIADRLGDIFVAHSQFGYWYAWVDFVDPALEIKNPTHWQPLPPPPGDAA